MKRHRLMTASALMCVLAAGHAAAQADYAPLRMAPDQEIALALEAAPAHLRAGASVYVWGSGGYERARAGSNGIHCMVNRDGQQTGSAVVHPTCWDREGSAAILPVELRVGALLAQGRPASEIAAQIAAGYASGEFFSPRKSGIAYMLRGDVVVDPATQAVRGVFPAHYMAYAPGLTDADIGLDEAARKQAKTLPFVYSGYAGAARMAYLIILAVPLAN